MVVWGVGFNLWVAPSCVNVSPDFSSAEGARNDERGSEDVGGGQTTRECRGVVNDDGSESTVIDNERQYSDWGLGTVGIVFYIQKGRSVKE